jgi:hypothetical protein
VRRAIGRSYAAIWGATAIGAAAGIAGVRLLAASAPYDALPPTPGTAIRLLGANAAVALWPLALLALGWHRLRGAAQVGDLLVRAQLFGNGLVAGNALGQQPRLALYLPHLPLEWLTITTPVAAWLVVRAGARATAIVAVGVTAAALVAAAVVETYLVPIA